MRYIPCFLLTAAILLHAGGIAPALSTAPVALRTANRDLLIPPTGAWLGGWSNGPGRPTSFEAAILEHEKRIGRKLDIAHTYHPVGKLPLNADEKRLLSAGRILLVNWKPSAKWADAAGSNTAVNATIATVARSMASVAPARFMVTMWGEPENDSVKTAGSGMEPADYWAMWTNVRRIFDQNGVANVVWVWNMMGYSRWRADEKLYWPGNAFVDWIMWDPYALDKSATFYACISDFYNWLINNSNAQYDFLSKPWGLAEWGVQLTTNNAFERQYYLDARANLTRFPRIKAYIIFDGVGTFDTRTDTTPEEQAAYNVFANDPYLLHPLPKGATANWGFYK